MTTTNTPERIDTAMETALNELMGVHSTRREKNLTPKEVGDYCRLVLARFAAALHPQPTPDAVELVNSLSTWFVPRLSGKGRAKALSVYVYANEAAKEVQAAFDAIRADERKGYLAGFAVVAEKTALEAYTGDTVPVSERDEAVAREIWQLKGRDYMWLEKATDLVSRHVQQEVAKATAPLKEYFDASEAVQAGIIDFDLHNDAVTRLEKARAAVYAVSANPAKKEG